MMMHPIDIPSQQEQKPPGVESSTGWWGLLALVVIVALLVTAVVLMTGDGESPDPATPQPTEAPVNPGS